MATKIENYYTKQGPGKLQSLVQDFLSHIGMDSPLWKAEKV